MQHMGLGSEAYRLVKRYISTPSGLHMFIVISTASTAINMPHPDRSSSFVYYATWTNHHVSWMRTREPMG
jgi:hypothetical protein